MDPRLICILDSQNSITRELHIIFGAYTTSGQEGSKNKSWHYCSVLKCDWQEHWSHKEWDKVVKLLGKLLKQWLRRKSWLGLCSGILFPHASKSSSCEMGKFLATLFVGFFFSLEKTRHSIWQRLPLRNPYFFLEEIKCMKFYSWLTSALLFCNIH